MTQDRGVRQGKVDRQVAVLRPLRTKRDQDIREYSLPSDWVETSVGQMVCIHQPLVWDVNWDSPREERSSDRIRRLKLRRGFTGG